MNDEYVWEEIANTFHTNRSVKHVCADAYFPVEHLPCGFEWEYNDPMYGPNLITEYPRVQEGKYKGEPLHVYVARMDTPVPTVLGVHSSKYDRSQDGYSVVLDQAERLFPDTAEDCVVYGNGERLIFTQNLGEEIDLGNGDTLKPRLVWTSSLDGSWSTAVRSMMYRFSCTNQLVNNKPIWKVRRTANHSDLVETRSRIMANQIAHAEAFASRAKTMASQEYTDEQFYKLIETLVPYRDTDSERSANNDAKKRGAILGRWEKEKADFGAGSHLMGSRWLAFNAVQGAEQHRINQNYKDNPDKALAKSVEGKTPLADQAWRILAEGYNLNGATTYA